MTTFQTRSNLEGRNENLRFVVGGSPDIVRRIGSEMECGPHQLITDLFTTTRQVFVSANLDHIDLSGTRPTAERVICWHQPHCCQIHQNQSQWKQWDRFESFWSVTRPDPITTWHFGANFNRSIGETERIDRSNSSRLNRVDDIFTSLTESNELSD